jgi:hypothetical protein
MPELAAGVQGSHFQAPATAAAPFRSQIFKGRKLVIYFYPKPMLRAASAKSLILHDFAPNSSRPARGDFTDRAASSVGPLPLKRGGLGWESSAMRGVARRSIGSAMLRIGVRGAKNGGRRPPLLLLSGGGGARGTCTALQTRAGHFRKINRVRHELRCVSTG